MQVPTDYLADLNSSPVIEVAILEDDEFALEGMMAMLNREKDMQVVLATSDPRQMIVLVRNKPPDIAVIDLRIADDDTVGIQTIRDLKGINPTIKCLVVTNNAKLPFLRMALSAGADGFVRKTARPGQRPAFAEAIRRVLKNESVLDKELVQEMILYMPDLPLEADTSTRKANTLSPAQRKILSLLDQYPELTNADIAQMLAISVNTVRSQIHNILLKLDVKSRDMAVFVAKTNGWIT